MWKTFNFGGMKFKAFSYGDGTFSVRQDTFKKIIKKGLVDINCDFKYTDDFAYDMANDFGRGAISVKEFNKKYGDRKKFEFIFLIESSAGDIKIDVSIHRNLHYTITENLDQEQQWSSSNVIKIANDIPATKKQLQTLQNITRMNTNNWNISFKIANKLIKTFKKDYEKGLNLVDYLYLA